MFGGRGRIIIIIVFTHFKAASELRKGSSLDKLCSGPQNQLNMNKTFALGPVNFGL